MKKGVLTAFFVGLLFLMPVLVACGSENGSGNDLVQPTFPAPRYQIETIVEGELLRVVTIHNAGPFGSWKNYPGANYGSDFATALAEIGKKYRIEKTDSILYHAGNGSLTGEIYVYVYPRE